MNPSLFVALIAGVGIAAAAGLRAFLPLFAMGIAHRFGLIGLHEKFEWLSSDVALVALGAATVVEVLADKVPVVDHFLDLAATFLRPIAAALAAYAFLIHWPTPWGQIVALILGAGALAMHTAKSHVRLGSTVTTAGAANPILSFVEDGAAFALIVAAILAPLAAVLLLIFLFAWLLRRRKRRTVRAAETPAQSTS